MASASNEDGPQGANPAGGFQPIHDLLDASASLLQSLGHPKTREVLAAHLVPDALADDYPGMFAELGFSAKWQSLLAADISPDQLPAIASLADGQYAIIHDLGNDGVLVSGSPGLAHQRLSGSEFAQRYAGRILNVQANASADTRANEFVPRTQQGWFWPVLWHYRRYYFEAISLASIINILTLASIIFTLTVYDRVLPNQAYVTLWSLAAGVVVAMILEFVSRTARTWVIDSAGKKIDLVLGDTIFDHVLRSRLEHRAQSSGAFANVFKEFEQVRGFVTSASLVAIADLPFAVMFIAVTAVIAGPLALVPLTGFILVSILALALQIPLASLAREGLRESSIRHGTVIESLEGLETLKTARAEPRMRALYESSSEVISRAAIKSSMLSGVTLNATMLIQQLSTVVLLVWGVYLVAAGQVTAGAIIASVQLTSRALAPLSSLTSLALRFQNVKSALASLHRIMNTPVDRMPDRQYLSGNHWRGDLQLRHVNFGYKADEPPVVRGVTISIQRGERVGIIGHMGSGKSTLLRLLAGLYQPRSGALMLDGVDCTQIEPADVRASIMLLPQDNRLFHGSLRENLMLSAPTASDEEMLRLAEWTGVKAIAAAHPRSFERPIGERGDTLSAGQRQAITLTRALLAKPKVLLLDEPTSSMDQASESNVLQGLVREIGDGTLVMVTHKAAVLKYVDRLIVVGNGQVVADGPKDQVLKALQDGNVKAG